MNIAENSAITSIATTSELVGCNQAGIADPHSLRKITF